MRNPRTPSLARSAYRLSGKPIIVVKTGEPASDLAWTASISRVETVEADQQVRYLQRTLTVNVPGDPIRQRWQTR
jgi:hypothetical protein